MNFQVKISWYISGSDHLVIVIFLFYIRFHNSIIWYPFRYPFSAMDETDLACLAPRPPPFCFHPSSDDHPAEHPSDFWLEVYIGLGVTALFLRAVLLFFCYAKCALDYSFIQALQFGVRQARYLFTNRGGAESPRQERIRILTQMPLACLPCLPMANLQSPSP